MDKTIKEKSASIVPKKILVLYLDSSRISDAVESTVIFPALSKKYPAAEIHAMYNHLTSELAENNPAIKKVFAAKHTGFFGFLEIPSAWELRKEGFDVCVSASNNFCSHAIAFLCGAKYRLGWDKNGSGFLLNLSTKFQEQKDSNTARAQSFLKLLEPLGITTEEEKKEILLFSSKQAMEGTEWLLGESGFRKGMTLVGMHAGSSPDAWQKRWPIEKFAELAEKIIGEKNVFIVLVGGKSEIEINQKIISLSKEWAKKRMLNAAGKLSLSELIALAKLEKAFIGNDSGPMHIAAASGCRTIALFGPTDELVSRPFGNVKIIAAKISCKPCCLKPTGKQEIVCADNQCMKQITVEEVYKAVENALG